MRPPPRQDLGRRYVELLAENLGQPGFRELLLVAHDIDARRDLVFALLGDGIASAFSTCAARREPTADAPPRPSIWPASGAIT